MSTIGVAAGVILITLGVAAIFALAVLCIVGSMKMSVWIKTAWKRFRKWERATHLPWWSCSVLSAAMVVWMLTWDTQKIMQSPRLWAVAIAVNLVATWMLFVGHYSREHEEALYKLVAAQRGLIDNWEKVYKDALAAFGEQQERKPTGKEYLN